MKTFHLTIPNSQHSKWDITDNEFIVVAETQGIAFEMALEFVKGVVPEKAIKEITIDNLVELTKGVYIIQHEITE